MLAKGKIYVRAKRGETAKKKKKAEGEKKWRKGFINRLIDKLYEHRAGSDVIQLLALGSSSTGEIRRDGGGGETGGDGWAYP